MSLNKGDYMSNTKHLADMLKVCSILPVFAVMPAMATDEAKLGDTSYSTFAEALANAQDGTAHTVSLIRDVADGKGSVVKSGSDVTIDFGGHEYTAVKNTVGSTGTETLMFQLLKDSDITMKNGTLSVVNEEGSTETFKVILMNYANLTLDNMFIDATDDKIWYGISNNNGVTKITNSKIAVGDNALFALDVWQSKPYGDVVVDIENTEIIGRIEVTADDDAVVGDKKHELRIDGGVLAAQTNGSSKIYNEGTLFVSNVDMNGNTGAVKGTAIYNTQKLTTGGEIAGRGIATINNVNFARNESSGAGGAIYNNGNMTISQSEFIGNKVLDGFGGAIINNANLKIMDNTNFSNNVAYVNGAVATYIDVGNVEIIGGRFDNNYALADGGALGLYGLGSVTGTWFTNNASAVKEGKRIDDVLYGAAYDSNGGGALFVGEKAKATLSNVHFYDNETGVNGGAIHARHGGLDGKNGAYLNIDVAEFDDNEAANYGGAISNIYGGVINISNAKFTLNDAGKSGGAIYNGVGENWGSADTPSLSSGNGTINFTNVQFIDNEAGENGGAIYNDTKGTMTFAGINTFANNKKHVGKYVTTNDIHNLGNISVVSGTTTLSGGVTGTGTFTIAEGAELYIGSSNIDQSSIVIDGTVFADVLTDGSSAYIDRAEKPENMRENNAGTYAKLLGNVTGSGSINLNIGSVGTYKMFSQENDVTINAGKAYEVTKEGTDVKIALKSVEKMAGDTGLSQRAAGAISSLATSSNRGIQMVSLAAQKLLNSDDPDAIAKIEQETAKLNPEDKPVTQSVTTSLNNQVLSLTAGRMSGGAPMVGRSGGDNGESGIWMQGLYNQSKSGDAFDGKTRGFALGADTLVANKYTLGLGFAYNNTDVSSGTRDTEIDSKTLFLYGQYKPNKWFANATLAYTMSEYTENTDPFGRAIENTYDVDAYGAQLMTGYDFATGITTEMGMRYLHIAQEEYESAGKPVAAQDTDFLTAVAGLKYAFYVQTDDALKFRPELRAALTYDVINDDNHATVMLPSVGTSYNVDGKALNKLGGEFGIGLTAEYKGMEFSVMYDLDLHEDYTSQTGMIKFRGRF